MLHTKWTHILEVNQDLCLENRLLESTKLDLEKKNKQLQSHIKACKDQESNLKIELDQLRKQVRMLNSSTSNMEETITVTR